MLFPLTLIPWAGGGTNSTSLKEDNALTTRFLPPPQQAHQI